MADRKSPPTRRWRSPQRVTCSCTDFGEPISAIVVAQATMPEVQREGSTVTHTCRTAKPLPRTTGRPPKAAAERLQVMVAQHIMAPVHALARDGRVPLRTALERIILAGLTTPEISAAVSAACSAEAVASEGSDRQRPPMHPQR